MHDVFISHSGADSEVARRIAERLSEAGVSVFFDQSLVAGQSLPGQIEDELKRSRAVVALLSSNSRSSSWVKSELQAALDRKKLVIPVLLDEDAKKNWVWPLLANRESIQLDKDSPHAEYQLDQLVQALYATLQNERSPVVTLGLPKAALPSPELWKIIVTALLSATLGSLVTWLLSRL